MTAAMIEQEELRDSIRQLLADEEWLLAAREDESVNQPRILRLWKEMAGLGWLGLSVGEDFGGLGLGLNELAVLYRECGRYLAPSPILPHMLAAQAIANAGTAEQKDSWLPRLAEGKVRASMKLPESGAPVAALSAGRMLTGTTSHVLGSPDSTHIFLPVRKPSKSLALTMLPVETEGVTLKERPSADPSRHLFDVIVDKAEVVEDQILDLGDAQWRGLIDHALIATACDSVGGAEHILEITVDYMGVREQFGRPIGSFQALKHRVASWKVLLEAASALVSEAVGHVAGGLPEGSAGASGSKFYACDAYEQIAGDAVQLHGGMGFTWEHSCHRFLKRAKLNQFLFGSAKYHQDRAAGFLFGASE